MAANWLVSLAVMKRDWLLLLYGLDVPELRPDMLSLAPWRSRELLLGRFGPFDCTRRSISSWNSS